MDWKNLFLNSKGRIGQKDFWIGFLILFVAGLVLSVVPVIGQIAGLILLYPWVCLYSQRLHDFGKSGWLTLVPVIAMVGAMLFGVMAGGAAMIGMGAAQTDAAATAAALGAGGMAVGIMAVAGLICLAFLLWVGLTKGDEGANAYGPPPVSLIGGTSAPAA